MLVDGSRGIERILGRPRPPNELTRILIMLVSMERECNGQRLRISEVKILILYGGNLT
jgi:hypothetical protein